MSADEVRKEGPKVVEVPNLCRFAVGERDIENEAIEIKLLKPKTESKNFNNLLWHNRT